MLGHRGRAGRRTGGSPGPHLERAPPQRDDRGPPRSPGRGGQRSLATPTWVGRRYLTPVRRTPPPLSSRRNSRCASTRRTHYCTKTHCTKTLFCKCFFYLIVSSLCNNVYLDLEYEANDPHGDNVSPSDTEALSENRDHNQKMPNHPRSKPQGLRTTKANADRIERLQFGYSTHLGMYMRNV